MAKGTFASSVCTATSAPYYRYIEVEWSSTNNTVNNTSTISWKAYVRAPNTSDTSQWVKAKNVTVTIGGVPTTLIGSTTQKLYKNMYLGEGTQTITHATDGTKSVTAQISAEIYKYGTPNSTYDGSIVMTRNPVYTLSISAGSNSTIKVERTSCAGVGTTGNMSAGTHKLCLGDTLRITFTANTNYTIDAHTVNAVSFTSGNTHTVKGTVNVASTARALASSVGATNANIGSVSTITVTKHNSSYYHSLQYSFGGLSGYIKADGTTSLTEVKFSQASVAFSVPTSFYAQIPNSKTGTCTITCRTYSGSTSATVLGSATTCTFTATASSSACAPYVRGIVEDVFSDTTSLTGDSSVLIRYRSKARCTIAASPNNSATISSKLINGITPTNNQIIVDPVDVTTNRFVFSATDSRGYTSSYTSTPSMVPYINLTCNPVISRPTPTGNSIVMKVSGDLYRGALGTAANSPVNTLILDYHYKEAGSATWSTWTTISSGIVYGTASYSSGDSEIELGTDFDYQKEYNFEVRARDGARGVTLSTVTKTITIARGIPVFDWGENDFNFNVPVSVNNERAYLVKYTDVTLSSVALTYEGANGVYFRQNGYSPTTDLGFTTDPTILGLTLLACSNVRASFVPYYNTTNRCVNFYSDVSQTVGTVVLRIVYV